MKKTLASLVLIPLLLASPGLRAGQEPVESKADETVKEALEAAGVRCTNDAAGNFLVSVKFKSGRGQNIVVISARIVLGTEEDGDEMREIYSVAMTSNEPPSAGLSARLLMENGSAKLGGWAVRKAADKYQIVYRAFVPAEVCEEELLPAMSFVATQADSLENTETGKDQN